MDQRATKSDERSPMQSTIGSLGGLVDRAIETIKPRLHRPRSGGDNLQ